MKETNDVIEFIKVLKEGFSGVSIFDLIKLMGKVKKHKKVSLHEYDKEAMAMLQESINKLGKKIFGEVEIKFDKGSDSYTVMMALPSNKSNMADGKYWGIPTIS